MDELVPRLQPPRAIGGREIIDLGNGDQLVTTPGATPIIITNEHPLARLLASDPERAIRVLDRIAMGNMVQCQGMAAIEFLRSRPGYNNFRMHQVLNHAHGFFIFSSTDSGSVTTEITIW